jgi:hypothetical protein
MDFDPGIKEAEIYCSMGLLKESLMVYYEKLFETDYPVIKIIPDFTESC